jgi:hypothetical protein
MNARLALTVTSLATAMACSSGGPTSRPSTPAVRSVLLITVDTLRADHVGAYGYAKARTPVLDGLARGGVVFDRAYAASPVTLPSHATLMTGRYPPGHGSRDNGLRVLADVPTLATVLRARGVRTAAFVAAFPLDHQFGLNRGFDVYGDQIPRGADGRLANERPASQVVDDAIAWLRQLASTPLPHPPHLPFSYGSTSSNRTRRTAIRPRTGQPWIATTTRSRRSTARSVDCSTRLGRRAAIR